MAFSDYTYLHPQGRTDDAALHIGERDVIANATLTLTIPSTVSPTLTFWCKQDPNASMGLFHLTANSTLLSTPACGSSWAGHRFSLPVSSTQAETQTVVLRWEVPVYPVHRNWVLFDDLRVVAGVIYDLRFWIYD